MEDEPIYLGAMAPANGPIPMDYVEKGYLDNHSYKPKKKPFLVNHEDIDEIFSCL